MSMYEELKEIFTVYSPGFPKIDIYGVISYSEPGFYVFSYTENLIINVWDVLERKSNGDKYRVTRVYHGIEYYSQCRLEKIAEREYIGKHLKQNTVSPE